MGVLCVKIIGLVKPGKLVTGSEPAKRLKLSVVESFQS